MTVDRSTRILIAVDVSNFMYTCIFSAFKNWKKVHSDEADMYVGDKWNTEQDNLPDLTRLQSFRKALNLEVQSRYGYINGVVSKNHEDMVESATGVDIVFAFDGNLDHNFRKKLYPEYKAQRKLQRQAFDVQSAKRYIENVVFAELNLEETKGVKFIKFDGCESDDIISTVINHCGDYMLKIVFSSDRDFLQLKDVHQYNCWGETIRRNIGDITEEPLKRDEFLLWKIIRGDVSDNIKNVFPKYGDKKSLQLVMDRDRLKQMLKEDNSAAERFQLNMALIDFRRIPKDVEERIWKGVEEKLSCIDEPSEFNIEECMVV